MPGRASERDRQTILQWLYDRGEETLAQVVEDLVGRKRIRRGVADVAAGAATARARLDRNLETLLHLLNIPSRADYHKLLVKVEHLQGSLVNLNLKLDRLLAALESTRKPASRRPGS